MSDRSVPFMETVSAQPVFCEMGLAPKTLGNEPILDSLKKKIMQEINSRAGESLLNGIVFKAVA